MGYSQHSKLACVRALDFGVPCRRKRGLDDAIRDRGHAFSMGHAVNSHPIIAVTCLSFEAKVAAGPGIAVLCGTAQRYVDKLGIGGRGQAAAASSASGLPAVCRRSSRPGDWVIASGVVADGVRIPTDKPLVATFAAGTSERSMPTFPGSTPRWWERADKRALYQSPQAPSQWTWDPTLPPGSRPGMACRSRRVASSSIPRSGRCRRLRWSACGPTAGRTCSP